MEKEEKAKRPRKESNVIVIEKSKLSKKVDSDDSTASQKSEKKSAKPSQKST